MPSGRATVSVVLGTFNGAPYLRAQLDSVLAQRRPADEILVADDRSTDDSAQLARDVLSRTAARYAVGVNCERLGATGNFERLLAKASGDLVYLCDQDDIWHEDKIAAVVECFARHEAVQIVQHDALFIGARGERLAGTMYERLGVGAAHDNPLELFRRLLRRNRSPGCMLALRRSFLEHALPVPAGFMHDEWLALYGGALGVVHLVDETLSDYRIHAANTLGLRGIGLKAVMADAAADAIRLRAAKVQRLRSLQDRLDQRPGTAREDAAALLSEAITHMEARQALPKRRLGRLHGVVAELVSGRYGRHASGALSAVRDLLASRAP